MSTAGRLAFFTYTFTAAQFPVTVYAESSSTRMDSLPLRFTSVLTRTGASLKSALLAPAFARPDPAGTFVPTGDGRADRHTSQNRFPFIHIVLLNRLIKKSINSSFFTSVAISAGYFPGASFPAFSPFSHTVALLVS